MDSLFGLSMTTIMWVLVALFAICVVSVAGVWLANRTMFRMGLRNIPRRRAQSTLVVLGLMLSTLIITAAFTTGDSINYSITRTAYDSLQRNDLFLEFGGASAAEGGSQIYVGEQVVSGLETSFQDDQDIAGFLPYLFERAPAVNPRTRLAEPAVTVAGITPERQARFGGLRLADGGSADLNALTDAAVFISERAAEQLDARAGDTLTLYVRGAAHEVRVAGVVKDEVASGVVGLAGLENGTAGMAMSLDAAQRLFGHVGEINAITVALTGDVRSAVTRSDTAAQRLEDFLASDAGKSALGLGDLTVTVETTKQDSIEQAEASGSLMTTFFLVLGLFSIAAGIMLIFLIFVMLAAERKEEMGMARAVGARRINLVQSFLAEGMTYNLLAGAVGAALGVGAAVLLIVGGARAALGDEGSFLTAHVTPRSLIVSYCLGVVITFVTVVVSSFRVSRLNIVAAIRGTDDTRRREGRRGTRWAWVAVGVPALVIPPLGLWLLLRKGFGLPNAWVWGPLGVLAGVAAVAFARPAGSLFLFNLGMSLLPLSVAELARYYHAPGRVTWTLVGAYLLAFWLVPIDYSKLILGESLDGNFEMFVLSGIMIVIGFTLVIVFNARVLTTIFRGAGGAGWAYTVPAVLAGLAAASAITGVAVGDAAGLGQLFFLPAALIGLAAVLSFAAARFPRFGPALKMGVAYPLANSFRTGMTIAMFSLIVFSLVTMNVMQANFAAIFSSDDARGGWDVVATTGRNNPVPDLTSALDEEGSFDTSQIRELGRATAPDGASEVRQIGQGDEWSSYPVRAASDAFFAANQAKLEMRATGYSSDREVYEAVRTQPNLAVVDALVLGQGGFGPEADFQVEGIEAGQEEFEPIQIEVRDPVSGRSAVVTVIGVFSSEIPARVISGLYTSEATYAQVFGAPDYRVNYLRLASGVDAEDAAKGIEAALMTRGAQAFSVQEMIDEQMGQVRGFQRIFQAYLGLGLFVGIAALGVIAFRSVVERRQQIGMLRAIGYQRGTVALTFLLESSFIALMGILSGVVGAAILSRNLMTSDDINESAADSFTFFIPWDEVSVLVLIAYGAALLLTWWPSRGAARVPIAEALRYE